MGELYDAPNQQVVRPDGSGPWEEGTGGSTREEQAEPQAQPQSQSQEQPDDDGLDTMTKDELLAEADARGVDANAAMTKDEIKAAIRGG
jgi:hypothetical protein